MNAARPVPGGRFRPLFVLAAAIIGVALGAAGFAVTSGTFPGIGPIPGFPGAAPAETAAPTQTATAAAAPAVSATAAPAASATDASASASASASAARALAPKAPPPAVPAAPKPPKPPSNCTPPFTMVDGVKKFKPECM